MIHGHHAYRTSFTVLHAPLQQNDCTSSSFPVTLRERHGHSDWNQIVDFSSLWHYTKFEANLFISILTHDDVKRIFNKIRSVQFSSLNIASAEKH